MELKKYDSYKDSGVEWIGKIPSHWKSTKVKFEILPKGYKAGPFGSSLITSELLLKGTIKVFSPEHVAEKEILEEWYLPDDRAEEMSQFIVKDKDVVLPIVGTLGLARVFHTEIDGNGIINQRLARISCNSNRLIPEFFCTIMKDTSNYQEYFKIQARGSILSHLNKETIVSMHIVLPDVEEQDLIINFLDHKTAQIDDLIAKKERLIQLLEEERTAIINQAVTKGLPAEERAKAGLDPTVPMKDSGIEWLGEIPEHWSLTRMRYLCDIGTGGKDTENREDDGEYPFYVRSQTVERISTYSFDGEAILTAGDGVGVCKVWHYVNEKFDYHQRVYRMSAFNGVLGRYLFYYLKENFVKEVMKLSAKSTVDSLRRPMFQNFQIAYGTLEEQKEIIEFLENHDVKSNALISKYEQEIELLKEYKTALISEVVTGKVDVRNVKLN
ncbi:MAG: restriction endonuclease subunit S [Fluviicola sp.]|nr:restriction endonuclease subunit S [Fluviicola sp.]